MNVHSVQIRAERQREKEREKERKKKSKKKSPKKKGVRNKSKKKPKGTKKEKLLDDDDDDEYGGNTVGNGDGQGDGQRPLLNKSIANDGKYNMQRRRPLIIRYVMLIVMMVVSSLTSETLLCFTNYPSSYIPFDIMVQVVCTVLMLWISQSVWKKLVDAMYCCCCCKCCCPVMARTRVMQSSALSPIGMV